VCNRLTLKMLAGAVCVAALFGCTSAGTDGESAVRVWLNPATNVYHCIGTGAYGTHAEGRVATQQEARKDGYRPAFGRACPVVPPAAGMAMESPSMSRAKGKGCGVERWPVKTLTDEDRSKVHRKPVPAAILDLVSIPRPDQQPPQGNRLAPTELTVFRVQARLTLVKQEKDQDFHIVLADPDDPETTMIAEVPSSTCAKGSGEEDVFDGLMQLLKPYVGQKDLDVPVEVEGVGFFDFLHNQTGVAPNGLELHPVLKMKIVTE
jgi:hypothetical protein